MCVQCAPPEYARAVRATQGTLVEEPKRDAAEAQRANEPYTKAITAAFFGFKGAGKTATIRRLLDQDDVDPFADETKDVSVREGTIRGVNFRLIDSPGLEVGASCQGRNRRRLKSALCCLVG